MAVNEATGDLVQVTEAGYSAIFPSGSAEETWIPRDQEQHGGIFTGMVRSSGDEFNFWTGSERVNPLGGTRDPLDTLRCDDPERALVCFYGMRAQGFTRNPFIGGVGAALTPVDADGRISIARPTAPPTPTSSQCSARCSCKTLTSKTTTAPRCCVSFSRGRSAGSPTATRAPYNAPPPPSAKSPSHAPRILPPTKSAPKAPSPRAKIPLARSSAPASQTAGASPGASRQTAIPHRPPPIHGLPIYQRETRTKRLRILLHF